ncbi:MAG: DUF2157 domain-containing protein [Erythrobacteraceae bacterium]|jgi:uncharacterized membrane protein|nr:DUF2157 domain-containing protein [Erythrobacteraceae bacterium]
MSARKIAAWHEAGLIDAATRDRLLAHEAEHARPLALWAVFGIGALAIGLGLVSVIAANWEDIPGQLRLAVHLALIVAALAALFLREARMAAASPWAVEALLFVSAALGLTFFGHLGQVYQTSSPLWQPLAVWLALFAPVLLLMGRSWPAAAAVMGGMIWCVWDYVGASIGFGSVVRHGADPAYLWLAFVSAAPVLSAPLAAAMRTRSARSDFWRRLEQLALAYAVGGASFACVLASAGGFADGEMTQEASSMVLRGVVAVLAGVGVVLARRGVSGQMAGAIIAGAGVAMPLAYGADDLTIPAAALFMMLWIGIAAAALAAHWRGVFQLAVAVIAFRLIILSFELAGDLLASGFGLIASGVLILGVAWAAVRVSKRFAPDVEGEA